MRRPPRGWPRLGDVRMVLFDFDGVFTDNKVYLDQDGTELVRCDRADGLAIDFLRAARRRGLLDARLVVLTRERNAVARARARKLKIECALGVSDKLEYVTGLWGRRKGEGKTFDGLVYLGNDLNDLAVIERAAFSVAPVDAHPRVKRAASVVLPRRGGDGFVRSFVERWMGMDRMSSGEIYELVSDR